jgi:hypothetical protein
MRIHNTVYNCLSPRFCFINISSDLAFVYKLCLIKDWASKQNKILAWHMSTTISRPLRGCSHVGPQEKGANASGASEEAPTLIFKKLNF